jgi:hypothetical protein
MPNFESPIGNKSFQSNKMRNLDIPDETGYHPNNANMQQPNIPHNYSHNHMYPQMPQIDESAINHFESGPSDAEIERQIREAREIKKLGKEKMSEGAKRRIEMLLGMTQSTKDVTLENTTVTIRTLKAKEMRDSIFEAAKFDGTIEAPFEIRRQLLARAITHVANIEIDQFIGGNTLQQKLSFLDELDDSFLSRLYAEYVTLSVSAKEKYAIKNEADAKEVVEDLKK